MQTQRNKITFFGFMQRTISELEQLGKMRTSETYASALGSFRRFRQGRDIRMDELDSKVVARYETWLKQNGLCPNSISFYMRILRAAYNKAEDAGLVTQQHPFKHVYTGVDKTVKRAIPATDIKKILSLDLSGNPELERARDLFMFSFYTRGMSFIDMAFLKTCNLRDGTLSYRRKKTGKQLSIKWEKCMDDIVKKHSSAQISGQYMLPIILSHGDAKEERTQYRKAQQETNRSLKKIARLSDIGRPLTMYTARHSWASIAQSKNIPLSVICEGMGHESEKTTLIYLNSLDTSVIDKANRSIIDFLHSM